jgi:hypothetical protein
MQYHNPRDLQASELVGSLDGLLPLSRQARLRRWADALEGHGPLNALSRIEYLAPERRRAYRDANTPLSVAFADPVLREAGLGSDRLGDAMDFFEMSDRDAHKLLCDCHYLGSMTGPKLAKRLRRHAAPRASLWSWAKALLGGGR